MPVTAVVGTQWGDEGKGKIAEMLAQDMHVVVRANGGNNAGHTIINEHGKFAAHLVPVGFTNPNAINVIGPGTVLHPPSLIREIQEIESLGVDIRKRLQISKKSHLVLPLHIMLDKASEQARGAEQIGTTKKGIGPTYMDKICRTGLRAEEMLSFTTLPSRMRALYHTWAQEYPKEKEIEEYFECCAQLAPLVTDTDMFLWECLDANAQILLEGAQAVLLDIDHGTYPHVTSSATGVAGLAQGSGIPASKISRRIGVAKIYCTRVGNGPFPTEMDEQTSEMVRQKGNEFGATTGRPRRCGWLDLTTLDYVARLNDFTEIVVTKLDVLSDINPLYVCEVPYRKDEIPTLQRVHPWTLSLIDDHIVVINDLPSAAKEYLARIEKAGSAPISMVSIGPKRHQLLTK